MMELKPCPFCGGEMTMVSNSLGYAFKVYHRYVDPPCLIEEPFLIPLNAVVKTRADAINAWNRRAD